MSIKLSVKKSDQKKIERIGARLLPDGKTWIIPDEITDINPFMEWLPKREGYIVQRPYFNLRANCLCWNCGRETRVVALGAKSYQTLNYEEDDKPTWTKIDDDRLIFEEIRHLDPMISASLQANYPSFQQLYSKKFRRKQWGNHCQHCQVLQEEDDEFEYGIANPLSPTSMEAAEEIRLVYFPLEFDYYICASGSWNTMYLEIIS